jgi:hypothetical protein
VLTAEDICAYRKGCMFLQERPTVLTGEDIRAYRKLYVCLQERAFVLTVEDICAYRSSTVLHDPQTSHSKVTSVIRSLWT